MIIPRFYRKLCTSFLFIFAILVSTQAVAEVPDELSYQGFLSSSGIPLNANVDIKFSLYDRASGGAALWSETHIDVPVSAGVFSVNLGSVTPLDLKFDVPYFLGIAVESDPEMLPRQKLTSVPYAVRGKNESTEVTVNCGEGETITDALGDSTPGGWRKIIVNGTCNEDVFIQRAKVEIRGSTNGKIVGQTAGEPAIVVYGVHNVVIRDITVSNGAGDGIVFTYGANGRLMNSTVENNASDYQLLVRYGSVLRMSGNTVTSSGSGGEPLAILVSDGSTLKIESNNIVTGTSLSGVSASLMGIRGSTVIIEGSGNTIDNTLNNEAIAMLAGTTFRQRDGHLKVEGDVRVWNLTNADFRDTDITGDVTVEDFSYLRLRDQSGNPANVTVTGTVFSKNRGHVDFKTGTRLDGDVNCTGSGSKSGTPTFLIGHSFVGC